MIMIKKKFLKTKKKLAAEARHSYETINLPDDILIILAKNYVTEKDGLSLSVSGASENFASFYGNNRF